MAKHILTVVSVPEDAEQRAIAALELLTLGMQATFRGAQTQPPLTVDARWLWLIRAIANGGPSLDSLLEGNHGSA